MLQLKMYVLTHAVNGQDLQLIAHALRILNAIIYCYKISTIHTLYTPSFFVVERTDLAQVFQVCLDT